jgi:hypothetical protein
MKQVERWQWIIDSDLPGRRMKTRWKMTEQEAQDYRRRNPVKVEHTREVCLKPETPEEAGYRAARTPEQAAHWKRLMDEKAVAPDRS